MIFTVSKGEPEEEIEKAYEETDPKVKKEVELDEEHHIEEMKEDPEQAEEPEPDESEMTPADNYRTQESTYDIEYSEPEHSDDAIEDLKKEGYFVKTKLEHDVDEIKKKFEPRISEDKESEYKDKRGIPRHTGRD